VSRTKIKSKRAMYFEGKPKELNYYLGLRKTGLVVFSDDDYYKMCGIEKPVETNIETTNIETTNVETTNIETTNIEDSVEIAETTNTEIPNIEDIEIVEREVEIVAAPVNEDIVTEKPSIEGFGKKKKKSQNH
jgi:hypothetical protein